MVGTKYGSSAGGVGGRGGIEGWCFAYHQVGGGLSESRMFRQRCNNEFAMTAADPLSNSENTKNRAQPENVPRLKFSSGRECPVMETPVEPGEVFDDVCIR